MNTIETGSKVTWTWDNYGTEEKLSGIVMYIVAESAYVLIGNSSRMVALSRLTAVGSAAPMRGNGRDALGFVIRNFPEGHRVRQICECLLWQATSGNAKIGNTALAIVNSGSAIKVWRLVRGILAKVQDTSQWSDVRRAADELA